MSHPINDKGAVGEGEKWVMGPTFQTGPARGMQLSGKVSLTESSFNFSSGVEAEMLKSLMTRFNKVNAYCICRPT